MILEEMEMILEREQTDFSHEADVILQKLGIHAEGRFIFIKSPRKIVFGTL